MISRAFVVAPLHEGAVITTSRSKTTGKAGKSWSQIDMGSAPWPGRATSSLIQGHAVSQGEITFSNGNLWKVLGNPDWN